MGKLFKNLTTDKLEASEDRLGGNYDPVPTGIYEATIKLAYAGEASGSKAASITVIAELENKKELRETIWITNRDGDNFYFDKEDKSKKVPLPGFTTIEDLCLLTTGEGLSDQDTEEKVVKIYNSTERKEVPTPVQVLSGVMGKKVKIAVLRQIVDKQKKNDAGVYENTGETRTENTIDKIFDVESGRTVNEFRHEIDTPEFMEAWDTKNTGKDRNRSKGAGTAAGGTTGTGRPAAFGEPKKKLFGK